MSTIAKVYAILDCPNVGNHQVPLLLVDEDQYLINADYKLRKHSDGTLSIPGSALKIEYTGIDVEEEDLQGRTIEDVVMRIRATLDDKGSLEPASDFPNHVRWERYQFLFKHPRGNERRLIDASNLGEALRLADDGNDILWVDSLDPEKPQWINWLHEVINRDGEVIPASDFIMRCQNHYTVEDIAHMCGNNTGRMVDLASSAGVEVKKIAEANKIGWRTLAQLIANQLQNIPTATLRVYDATYKPWITKAIANLQQRHIDVPEKREDIEGNTLTGAQILQQDVRERAWIIIAPGHLRCARTGAMATYDKEHRKLPVGMPMPNSESVHLTREMDTVILENDEEVNLSLIEKSGGIGFADIDGAFGPDNKGHLGNAIELQKTGILRISDHAEVDPDGAADVELIDPDLIKLNQALHECMDIHHGPARKLITEEQAQEWVETFWDVSKHFPDEDNDQWLERTATYTGITEQHIEAFEDNTIQKLSEAIESDKVIHIASHAYHPSVRAFTQRPKDWTPKLEKAVYEAFVPISFLTTSGVSGTGKTSTKFFDGPTEILPPPNVGTIMDTADTERRIKISGPSGSPKTEGILAQIEANKKLGTHVTIPAPPPRDDMVP